MKTLNREFLQLAQDYDPDKHKIAGMMMSEKLDGQRAMWDGGWSRGKPCEKIPWANTAKDHRFIYEQFATGLWTRYGRAIQAPDWFLDQLPQGVCLDGELHLGRDSFQDLGFVRGQDASHSGWKDVEFMVFDSPAFCSVFQEGRINNPNFQKYIGPECMFLRDSPKLFIHTYEGLDLQAKQVRKLDQVRLPFVEAEARDILQKELDRVTDLKGEGLMLRSPGSVWTPKRVNSLLKVKKLLDSEATVVGCTAGRETDKGSKLLGMMGALIVRWEGKVFELAGFTNEERRLTNPDYAAVHPGLQMPDHVSPVSFPLGSVVTFRYRTLTNDGIPREARYLRKTV